MAQWLSESCPNQDFRKLAVLGSQNNFAASQYLLWEIWAGEDDIRKMKVLRSHSSDVVKEVKIIDES